MTQSLKLEWSDALMTGDQVIDAQHKFLVDLINEVAEVLETQQTEEKLGPILPLLQYYSEWHFEREENCMFHRQCPMAQANKDAHGQFLAAFQNFKDEYHQQGPSQELGMRMYQTLTGWLINHIQKVDSTISQCPEESSV